MYNIGSNGRSALRDIMSLFRLTKKYSKLLPVLQLSILVLHVYDLCSISFKRGHTNKNKDNLEQDTILNYYEGSCEDINEIP